MDQSNIIKSIKEVLWQGHNRSISAILTPIFVDKQGFWEELRENIEAIDKTYHFLGPFKMWEFTDQKVFQKIILDWFCDQGFISSLDLDMDAIGSTASLSIFFENLVNQFNFKSDKTLLIGVDDVASDNINDLFNFYSLQRKFCTEWEIKTLSVNFISIGNWIPSQLERKFFKDKASWPFHIGDNLHYFPDLTVAEIHALLLESYKKKKVKDIHSQYLWEITKGDRMTVEYILDSLPPLLSCDNLLLTSFSLVEKSQDFLSAILQKIQNISEDGKKLLRNLLEGYWIGHPTSKKVYEELLSSGLVARYDGNLDIYVYKNWIIESALRFNKDKSSKWIEFDSYENYRELIPPITCLNSEAYRCICEIENILRNVAILRANSIEPNKPHPLYGIKVNRNDRVRNQTTENGTSDIFILAKEWRDQVQNSHNVSAHAALVSYIQTADLIGIINYLVNKKDPLALRLNTIRRELNALKEIRNSIAHNQIISEDCYDSLLAVRNSLLAALKKSK